MTLFVAGRVIGLLVVPVALTGAALVLVRRRRQTWVMRRDRVIVWALYAPSGSSEPTALEPLIAAELAAASELDLASLRLARALVREFPDPWQRELAAERLGRAEESLVKRSGSAARKGELLTATTWATTSSSVVLAWALPVPSALAVALCALALPVSILTWSKLCGAWGERPHRLARTALLPVVSTPFAVSEQALVRLLVELGRGDRTVLDGALDHLDEMRWSPITSRAHARMHAACQVVTLGSTANPRVATAAARRTT
ncbi:MAG TPA: hypothetical protein VM388_07240 [Acidimicrobiales bacterium]|nr:hypothetical protein [Acidimicrobiales bacterium]